MSEHDTNAAGYVERIERLEGERASLAEDLKQVYAEAKGEGHDPKVLKALVAARRKDFEAYRALHEEVIALGQTIGG